MADLRFKLATAALAACLLLPGLVRAQDQSAFDEVLKILKRGGMIDEAGETKVKAMYAAEKQKSAPKWLEGFQFSGDLRARFDGSYFDQDQLGNEAVNRGRGRYRARFGFTKKAGSWATMGVRLASSAVSGANPSGDRRSGNASFGESGNDEFSPDSIFFDRVFASFALTDTPELQTQLAVGKTANPFLGGKYGAEFLLFDHDINPEGIYLSSTFRPSESTRLFGSVGTFIIKEVSGDTDPKFFGGQVGFETKLASSVSLGVRAGGYEFRGLDGDQGGTFLPVATNTFFSTAFGQGNLPSAFAESHPDRLRLGETSAFVQFDVVEGWPLLFYGTAVKNFSADSRTIAIDPDGAGPLAAGVAFPDEDMAYGVGFELGDNARFVKLGLSYYRVEANAVVGQFTDSDLFDGFTNRKGWMLFASRKLNSNVELRVTWFDGKELKDRGFAAGPFAGSLRNANRKRIQADAIVSF